MVYLYTILVMMIGFLAHDPDHWHSQIMIGEMVVIFWLSLEVNTRIHKILGIALLYFGIYSVYCQFAETRFFANGASLQRGFDIATARSLLFLLLVSLPFIFTPKERLKEWLVGFQVFAICNVFWMLYSLFFLLEPNGWHGATGMIGMDSVDGTFLALMLPTFIFSKNLDKVDKYICLGVLAIGLLISRSSTVYGVLAMELMVYVCMTIRINLKTLALALLMALTIVPVGYLYLGQELFHGNGRREILIQTYQVFKGTLLAPNPWHIKAGNLFFGLGTGAFLMIMPIVQGMPKFFFLWLHNEPAQVLFEQGLIGLILLIMVFITMLKKTYKNVPMLMMTMGLGLQAFIQPCFRYFLFAFFIAFFVRLSFEKEAIIGNGTTTS